MTVPVVRFAWGGGDVQIEETRRFTLVYDGTCKVCGRLAKVLERWDRHGEIEVVPSQRGDVQARFPWIPPQAYNESMQLVGPGGKTWQGAAAIEQLLGILPRGRWISWIFAIPLVGPIVDRMYRWFARNRYRFGCGEHCQYRPLDLDYGAAGSVLDDEGAGAALQREVQR